MIKARVETVGTGMDNNSPIVILAKEEGGGILPIQIGLREAQGIILVLEEKELPRPLTYDLMKNIFEEVDITLLKVIITRIEDGTFYANIELEQDGETRTIDSRPSDAINLVLRTGAPIYISESLADEALIYGDPYEFVEPYQVQRNHEED